MTAVAAASDVAALTALEQDILGKKGRLTIVLRGIGALAPEDRPKVGSIANAVRTSIEGAIDERGTTLRQGELGRAARTVQPAGASCHVDTVLLCLRGTSRPP